MECSYYIRNAPVSVRLKLFVWLSGVRWAIEQCFEEAKSEPGVDHYVVRRGTPPLGSPSPTLVNYTPAKAGR
jgi:hypothetical protein